MCFCSLSEYIEKNKYARPDPSPEPSVSKIQENVEITDLVEAQSASLPMVRRIDQGANALSTFLLEWKQNERKTTVIPQYKILFTMMFTFWMTYRLT